jgi:hypothetical protein
MPANAVTSNSAAMPAIRRQRGFLDLGLTLILDGIGFTNGLAGEGLLDR